MLELDERSLGFGELPEGEASLEEPLPRALYLSRVRAVSPKGFPHLVLPLAHRLAAELNPLGRYLYRMGSAPFPHLILQTWAPPRLDRLPEGLVLEGPKALPKEALQAGRLYRFYLQGAPLKESRPYEYGREFSEWVRRRLRGAEILNLKLASRSFLHIPPPKRGTLLVGQAEGILRLRDPDPFWEVLALGVGRGKAYGLGLVSLGGAR